MTPLVPIPEGPGEIVLTQERLALWTRHSAAMGRSLGRRLRTATWAEAARSVARRQP